MPAEISKPHLLTDAERRRCVLTLRLIWGAVLMGPLVLGAVLFNGPGPGVGSAPSTPPWVGWLPMVLLLAGLPISYFIRNQCYKRNWHGLQIDPAGYVTGNLVVFALLELVVVAGLVVGAIVPGAVPARAAAAAALVLIVLNFPNGRPLDPQPPGLGARRKPKADGGR